MLNVDPMHVTCKIGNTQQMDIIFGSRFSRSQKSTNCRVPLSDGAKPETAEIPNQTSISRAKRKGQKGPHYVSVIGRIQ